jgi:preprotein translocase subunit YajC
VPERMTGETLSMLLSFLPLVLIFVLMYFILIRPQKKKDKETQKMRNNIQVGDEIITIGGIIGIVISLKEDNVVIETAGERNKIRIKRWAIQSNETVHDDLEG